VTSYFSDFPTLKPYLLYFQTCRAEQKGNNTFEVYFDNFAPGSVVAFDITMETKVKNALGKLRYASPLLIQYLDFDNSLLL